MQGIAASTPATLIRYRDPKGAIDWLSAAFAFQPRFVATRADGSFAYAHMALGEQRITLSARDERSLGPSSETDNPADRGGEERRLVVADIAAHFAAAKAAGAEIVQALAADEDGVRGYACRDVEGNVWSFRAPSAPRWMGAYWPRLRPRAARYAGITAAASLTIIALGIPAWRFLTAPPAAPATAARAEVASEPPPKITEDRILEHARFALAEEQAAREVAEASRRAALDELEKERNARLQAEREARQFETELSAARATAERVTQEMADQAAWTTRIARSGDDSVVSQNPGKLVPVSVAASIKPQKLSQRPANPVLAPGQAALARGDVEEARRQFRRLADEGIAAAALALGSTYDPLNIAQAGLAPGQADREQAKRWYRRAIELSRQASERQATP
jgi:uncharacterized glyoxalase superfamily protein PhnB